MFKDLDYQVYKPMVSKLRTNSKSALIFPLIFLTRRLLIVSIIFGLKDNVDFQLIAFMGITLIKCIFQAHSDPFISKTDNNKEIFTEVCLLQCSILLIILKMFVGSPNIQNHIGIILVTIATLNVIPILAMTISQMGVFLKKYIKDILQKIKQKKLDK